MVRQTPGLGMLWGGPCDSDGEGLSIVTLYRLGPPAIPIAPDSSHGLAINPFCLGKLLDPCEMGAMRTRGWEGGSPQLWGTHIRAT